MFGPFSYSGGVAQNVVINRAMLDVGMEPHIDPWAYDGGCSIGALNFLLDKHNIERYADWVQDDEAPVDEPDVWTTIKGNLLQTTKLLVGIKVMVRLVHALLVIVVYFTTLQTRTLKTK